MRRRALLFMGCTVLVACNAIVGVDDVVPKGSSTSSSSSSTSGGGPERDADGTPLTPVPPDRDAGPADANKTLPECNGVIDCERLVFVTRAKFTGKLGGLSGADQKCFEAAKTIPGFSGRAFRAWLSDSTASIGNRLVKSTKSFRRTDGSVFATSFTDLTDGTVNLPPALDEKGAALGGSLFERSVWTSSDQAGKYNGASCNDWTSDVVTSTGNFGDSEATDAAWTEVPGEPIAQSSCNAEKHLYCIEY